MKTPMFALLLLSLTAGGNDHVTVKADETVCLPSKVCVSVAALEIEFKDYAVDAPPPVLVARQNVIDANTRLAQALEQIAALQGQMGPLQAQQNQAQLKAMQSALDAELQSLAPKGKVWDAATRRYVDKPKG